MSQTTAVATPIGLDHFGGSEERLIDYELFYRNADDGKVWHHGVRGGVEFEEPLTGADVNLNWLQKAYEFS